MRSNELGSLLASFLEGRKVAILGFGREGQSTYRLLRRWFPGYHLTLLDARELTQETRLGIQGDAALKAVTGPGYLSSVGQFDLVFKTPGISPYTVELQEAKAGGTEFTSQTDLIFRVFGAKVIAVTGTKGKSTTSSLITQVLMGGGKKAMLIGNIGLPAFDHLAELDETEFIVYETSSHQCESLTYAPHRGVFLNLYQDHLDYYPSMEDYALAKQKLFALQETNDLCFYNTGDPKVMALLNSVRSRKVGFSLGKSSYSAAYIEAGYLMLSGERLLPVGEIPLLGSHNYLNCLPAALIASELNIPRQKIAEALRGIKPVSKRLETVGVVHGVTFIDDALATIPEATIAALSALGPAVVTLIAGGFDRGQEFETLGEVIAGSQIRTLILFPTTGQKIANAVKRHRDISCHFVSTMEEAVNLALLHTPDGKTALLSAASASFGNFADYRDRSNQLIETLRKVESSGHAN